MCLIHTWPNLTKPGQMQWTDVFTPTSKFERLSTNKSASERPTQLELTWSANWRKFKESFRIRSATSDVRRSWSGWRWSTATAPWTRRATGSAQPSPLLARWCRASGSRQRTWDCCVAWKGMRRYGNVSSWNGTVPVADFYEVVKTLNAFEHRYLLFLCSYVFSIKPPMCTGKDDIDFDMSVFCKCLGHNLPQQWRRILFSTNVWRKLFLPCY